MAIFRPGGFRASQNLVRAGYEKVLAWPDKEDLVMGSVIVHMG